MNTNDNNVNNSFNANNNSSNNGMMGNMPNNNFSNPSVGPNNNKGKNNNLPIIIIAVIVGVLILLFFGSKLLGVGGSFITAPKTVNINSPLRVKSEYDDNFSIKVEDVEENYTKDYYTFARLKLKITNNSSKDLLLFTTLELVDENNKNVAYIDIVNIYLAGIDDNLDTTIPAHETKEGYVYFTEPKSSFSKLNVKVPKNLKVSNGTVSGDYENYYIKLK